MTSKIKLWQWPNVLAIDASIIAVFWLGVFSDLQSASISNSAYLVLGLSVWLTYISDRLFDATPRGESQLLSLRHRFAKKNARILWQIWAVALVVNILIASAGLNQPQLQKGFVLLLICLGYTGFNHFLSKRFFPKELLVAFIFTGGTQVFLPEFSQWHCLAGFLLLCLGNCLVIGWKERSVDAMLKVRSITSFLNISWLYPALIAAVCLSVYGDCAIALLPSILALWLVHLRRSYLNRETFRVLCDASLLIGPMLYFLYFSLTG